MVLNKLKQSIVAAIAAVSLSAACGIANAEEIILDSSAAIVNSEMILQSELNHNQKLVEQNFKARGAKVDALNARRAALEQLVTRSIVLQEGRKSFQLTDTQIDQQLRMAAARTNSSVQDLLKRYGAPDEATARQMFTDDVIINEVRSSQVRRRIRIADTEIDLLAKTLREVGSIEPSYHLAQIILPLDARASFDEVNRVTRVANLVKGQARNGADFNLLAAQYAQGSTASQGGDLGYIPESQVPVPFLPALLKAHNGDILGPFRSPYGLHLIKLYDVSTQSVEPITTYKASHILLKTSVVFSDEAAYKELQALRRSILNGHISFASAAKKYSEDTVSAMDGGNLGYAPANRYDPSFAQAMVGTPVGTISQPIKSSFGWHLIYVTDKKIDKDSDEAYRLRARELIYNRMFQQESLAWEREIRANAYVRVTDPTLVNAGLQDSINSSN